MEKDILRQKYQLAKSKEWQLIKSYMYENIKTLAVSDIDSDVIKGMLKNIYDTDKWVRGFEKVLKEEE